MEFSDFNKTVTEVKACKPRLFGLESDRKASKEELEYVEAHFSIRLPEMYKSFFV